MQSGSCASMAASPSPGRQAKGRQPSPMHAKAMPDSPWAALLQDNLDAESVANFLSSAIAQKEASLLSSRSVLPTSAAEQQLLQLEAASLRQPPSLPVTPSAAASAARPAASPGGQQQATQPMPSGQGMPSMMSPGAAMRETLGSMRAEIAAYEPTSHASSRVASPERSGADPRLGTQSRAEGSNGIEGLIRGGEGLYLSSVQDVVDSVAQKREQSAQWQAWVLKAQQLEAAAREEARGLSAQLERLTREHAAEIAESSKSREALKAQSELRQYALEQAIESRDEAIGARAAIEEELERARVAHAAALAEAEGDARRATQTAAEAQVAPRPLARKGLGRIPLPWP